MRTQPRPQNKAFAPTPWWDEEAPAVVISAAEPAPDQTAAFVKALELGVQFGALAVLEALRARLAAH